MLWGSPWQHLNIHLAAKRGWQSTVVRLMDHWDLHWRLWSGFMVIAEHCKRVNAAVILEWPKNCEYWKEPAVYEFLERLDFQYTQYDGCMYGLMSKFTGVVALPIRHPWKIAYINCDIGNDLNKVCDKSHRHAPCSGLDALYAQ